MLRLPVQFADAELADLRWATLHDTTTSHPIDSRQTTADALPSALAQHPHRGVITILQHYDYMRAVASPEGREGQLLSASE